jgi:hypothetical protein
MVIHFRVGFEIADNRANNLVVGAVSPVENLKFPLEDGKQPLNIAMLLGQALNARRSPDVVNKLCYSKPNMWTSASTRRCISLSSIDTVAKQPAVWSDVGGKDALMAINPFQPSEAKRS